MSDISNGPPNNMQETKGKCCDKCEELHYYGRTTESQCKDSKCTCHIPGYSESDAFIEEMAESMSKLQEVAKKQGANEFKQKILDAFTRFLGANNEKLITISEVQTIISNLEV